MLPLEREINRIRESVGTTNVVNANLAVSQTRNTVPIVRCENSKGNIDFIDTNSNITEEMVSDAEQKLSKLLKNSYIKDDVYNEIHNIIMEELNLSVNSLEQLSTKNKYLVLSLLIQAVENYAISVKNNTVEQIDTRSFVSSNITNIKMLMKEAGFNIEDVRMLHNEVGNLNIKNELTARGFYNAKNDDEKCSIIHQYRVEAFSKIDKEEQAELAECQSEIQRKKITGKHSARRHFLAKALEQQFVLQNGANDDTRFVVYLSADGNSVSNTVEETIESFKPEHRIHVANSFKQRFLANVVENYGKYGESVSTDTYREVVNCVTKNMDKDSAEQFKADAEALKSDIENGNIEFIYYNKEYEKAQNEAIISGITENKNLTVEEKNNFISSMTNESNNTYNKNTTVETKDNIPNDNYDYNKIKNDNTILYERAINVMQQEQNNTELINKDADKKAASKEKLEYALSQSSFEEVRKLYPENTEKDFAVAILHNPNLRHHKQHITGYIKKLPAKDLSIITKGCSTDMFCFVLRNIEPSKAGQLYDLSKKDKCYAARKLGEKVLEESKDNVTV